MAYNSEHVEEAFSRLYDHDGYGEVMQCGIRENEDGELVGWFEDMDRNEYVVPIELGEPEKQ